MTTRYTVCIHAVPEGSRCKICDDVVHIHNDADWPDEMGEGVKYVIHGPVRMPPWLTRDPIMEGLLLVDAGNPEDRGPAVKPAPLGNESVCPKCGSTYWGSSQNRPLWRTCHNISCGHVRPYPTPTEGATGAESCETYRATRPEWVNCIDQGDKRTFCGLPGVGYWLFVDVDHAQRSIDQESRLQPCERCMDAATPTETKS